MAGKDTVYDVAVVGGGASGLAAAGYLHRNGLNVCVFEKQPEVGGRLKSVFCRNGIADTGAAFLCSHFGQTMKILKKAGLEKDIVRIKSPLGIFFNGKITSIPVSPVKFLTTPVLPGSDKIRLAGFLPGVYRLWSRTGNGYAELPGNGGFNKKTTLQQLARKDDISLADYVHKQLNSNVLEKFIYPAIAPFYFWTPENTSRVVNIPGVVMFMGGKIFAVRGGIGAIAGALAGGAGILTGAGVSRLMKNKNCWLLEITFPGVVRTVKAKSVILAIPAPRVAELIAEVWPEGAGFISEFCYTPSIVVVLCLSAGLGLPWYGVTTLRNNFSLVSTLSIQSNKYNGLARPDKEMITVYLTGPASSRLLNMDREYIIREVLREVMVILGRDIAPIIDHVHVYRRELGQPLNPVGHFKRLWRLKNTPLPEGLHLAGDYLELPCIEGAVCAGLAAAREAARS